MSELPEGWARTPINAFTRTKSGNSKLIKGKLPREFEDGLFPAFSASGQDVWVEEPEHSGNAIIVSAVGARSGKTFRAQGQWSAIANTHIVWPEEIACDPDFLQYLLNDEAFWEKGGSAQPFVKVKATFEREIDLPPLAEQKRIVAKIDSLTAKSARARTELTKIEALVERYKAAVLSNMWTAAELAVEGHQVGLEDLISEPIRNGLSMKGSDAPPGQRALKLSALRSRTVDMADFRYLPIDEERAEKYLVRAGDLLISRGNGTLSLLAIPSIVPNHPIDTIFPDTAFRLRVNPDRVSAEWLLFLWQAPQLRNQIESFAKTTAGIWKVSQGDLRRCKLPIPTLAVQRQMLEQARSYFSRIETGGSTTQKAMEKLRQLDSAILSKAFSGSLLPQNPADEPAAELLARIKAVRDKAPKKPRQRRQGGETKVSPIQKLNEALASWPDDGLTFDELRESLPGSYEVQKDAIFDLLSSDPPKLRQEFDENDQTMKLKKV